MRILLTNDDGWFAPGLQAVRETLSLHHDVLTVAPDRNRSGASHSLTLQHSISAHEHADGVWAVEGTPVDCVHYALGVLYPQLGQDDPDLIVSGINHGQNLGDDTLYSGTVAAAIEGRYLAYPSLAVSVAARQPAHLADAAQQVLRLVDWAKQQPTTCKTYNVNIPDRETDDLRGAQLTALGRRSRWRPPELMQDPRGRKIYWIGAAEDPINPATSTDFGALDAGWISVTPLQTDLTDYSQLPADKLVALNLPTVSV